MDPGELGDFVVAGNHIPGAGGAEQEAAGAVDAEGEAAVVTGVETDPVVDGGGAGAEPKLYREDALRGGLKVEREGELGEGLAGKRHGVADFSGHDGDFAQDSGGFEFEDCAGADEALWFKFIKRPLGDGGGSGGLGGRGL